MNNIPKVMKRWQMDGIGREFLKLCEVETPTPITGEILVKVDAVSLNYRDKMVIESGRGLQLNFPFTPGSDLAGSVVAIGDGVQRFAIGDAVISTFTPDWIDGTRPGNAKTPYYRTLGGFYPGVLSEYVVFSEEWFVKAPSSLTPVQACTLPCAGVTAWFALVERAKVKPGDIVLIPSTGGVALFGLQIAKAQGATVIISGRMSNKERVEKLGADHYIDKAMGEEDWIEAVLQITQDRGADHILEVIGGDHLATSVKLAAVGGTVYQIGALEGFNLSTPSMPLMLKDVTIHGIGTGSRNALENLVRAVDAIGLKPVADVRYPLAELSEALDTLAGGAFGKIVIELS